MHDGLQMTQSTKKPISRKMIFLAVLGLIIPLFLVSMAFLAVNGDAKNQEKYKQQREEIMQKVKAREARERAASEALASKHN